MAPDNIVFRAAAWIIPLAIAIVFHEVAHGWVANAFGDPTARCMGRLSLNPSAMSIGSARWSCP